MTASTAPCSRCGAPYLEGRVCAGSNYTLPCNEPGSTDPGAVTLTVGDAYAALEDVGCGKRPAECVAELGRFIRQQESALTAMTTRAETPPVCRACGEELTPECAWVADGCPCNSPRGVNHGLVPRRTCTCIACDPEQTGSTRRP